MYHFVDQKTCKILRIKCEEILKTVQKELVEYFTFQFLLIGSGERRLVTQNEEGVFDLDYNLILMKDKKGLIDNPKRIKELFLDAFHRAFPKLSFKNSTSVITSNLCLEDIVFSFDCAIVCEGNNGNLYKIVFDKPDRYIWNEIRHTKDFNAKYRYLLSENEFPIIRDLYLKKKNQHLRQNDGVQSFSILVETVNEIMQKTK